MVEFNPVLEASRTTMELADGAPPYDVNVLVQLKPHLEALLKEAMDDLGEGDD